MFGNIKVRNCIVLIFSSAFLAFGLYNVHSLSGVTEGGALGFNLLLEYWFKISPSVTNFVVSVVCYLVGWRLLGREFIIYSAVAAGSFSVFYRIFESFPHIYPKLCEMPLAAAILGAVFVGVGTGISIRFGGAICGDDALAMSISHVTGLRIEWVYMISDLTILGLSLTYIPLTRIVYSVLTVILSGQIIGFVQRVGKKKELQKNGNR